MADVSGAGSNPGEPGAEAAARPLAVKICGLTRSVDACHAEAAGADYLGFVLTEGFSRTLPPDRARDIVAETSAPRVGVLVDESPSDAVRLAASISASVLQLHGSEDRSTIEELRDAGEWTIWKAVRARSLDDVRQAVDQLGDVVDGFLVEGWREGVVGGGGVRVSLDPAAVRAAIPDTVTFVLAGGLDPERVADAVARFHPDVVDVSSGIEQSAGIKDPKRVADFLQAARAAGRVPPIPGPHGGHSL